MTRRPAVAAFVASWVCGTSGLGAQDTTAQRASDARCDSIVARARVDTVSSGLFLALKRVDGGDLATAQITDMLLLTGAAFIPPTPFRLTVFSGPAIAPSFRRISASAAPVLRSPTLTGAYRVKVGRGGAFASLETIRVSLMPGFDSAAMIAIKSAGDAKGLFAPRDGTPSATIDFRFATDSVGGPGWTVRRLVTTTFPRMPVTDATVQSGSSSADLPQSERREGLPTETVLRFVVDRTGEPIMETLEIVRGTSIEFVRAALMALVKQRFVPARVNGCPVAQLIEFPFTLPPLSPSGALPPSDVTFRY
jgi:Gram-negative bacterial TonB protein C-terminal